MDKVQKKNLALHLLWESHEADSAYAGPLSPDTACVGSILHLHVSWDEAEHNTIKYIVC
jgi:hypothetical protein